MDLTGLYAQLGYRFRDPTLVVQALTHRSLSTDHNERLEFLGDALLGGWVSAALYRRFPECPEGDLTRLRATYVSRQALAHVAHTLGLAPYVRVGAGMEASGVLLGNVLEALAGAIYVDGGWEALSTVAQGWFCEQLRAEQTIQKDPKSALQEYLQRHKSMLPDYTVIRSEGPAHALYFHVRCWLGTQKWMSWGSGKSRSEAEQRAAAAALSLLTEQA